MTIFDAMVSVLGFLGGLFGSPLFMSVLAALSLVLGISFISGSIVGFAEREYAPAAVILILGLLAIFMGISMIVWVGSSAGPFEWTSSR